MFACLGMVNFSSFGALLSTNYLLLMLYKVTVYEPVKSCLPMISETQRKSQRVRHLVLRALLQPRSASKFRTGKFQ